MSDLHLEILVADGVGPRVASRAAGPQLVIDHPPRLLPFGVVEAILGIRGRQRPHGVERLIGMLSQSPLGRSPGTVVLHPVGMKDFAFSLSI